MNYNPITMSFLQQIKEGKNPQELMMNFLENQAKRESSWRKFISFGEK